MTSTCDLADNRVLMAMQMTEEPYRAIFKEINSIEEAIQAFKPSIEIIIRHGSFEQSERIEITDFRDLSFSELFNKSKSIHYLLKLINFSFEDLYRIIVPHKESNAELRPLSNYFDKSTIDEKIETNLHYAFELADILICNYVRLAQFFHFSPRYHWENPYVRVTILNASTQQLSDLDNPCFIDAISEQFASVMDRFDNSKAYSILVIPNEFTSLSGSSIAQIHEKYLRIAARYNVIFLSEIGIDDEFQRSTLEGGMHIVPWYFMSTRLSVVDRYLRCRHFTIGLSHLLCSFILVHHRFHRHSLDCYKAIPLLFELSDTLRGNDSHFPSYEKSDELHFMINKYQIGKSNHNFHAVATNFVKVFANKLLLAINQEQTSIDLFKEQRKNLKSILRARIEKEKEDLQKFWSYVIFNWKDKYCSLPRIHEIEYMINCPITEDVYLITAFQIQATISFHSINDSAGSNHIEDESKFRILVANYDLIENRIDITNKIHVEQVFS
jgi:hypothetical protein